MRFPTIEIFDWFKTVPEGLNDLASSGMHGPVKLSELGLNPVDLPIAGNNRYGYPPLMALLGKRYGVDSQNIVVTPGASMANFTLAAGLLDNGDAVMIESPGYQPFVRVVESLTERFSIPLFRRSEDDYRLPLDLSQLRRVRPKLVIISNPHNPTGRLDNEGVGRLARELAAWGGWLLVDEVFLPFAAGWNWETAAKSDANVLSVNSLTKAWGLSGLRVGWIIAPKDLCKRLTRLMDHMHVDQPFFSEWVAHETLANTAISDSLLITARVRSVQNKPLIEEYLGNRTDLNWTRPDAGIMALIRFADGQSSSELCRNLQERHRVLVMPGVYFDAPDGFRIGFGGEPDRVEEGLDAIRVELESAKLA